MPAYMISQVTVTDQEKFKSYLASTTIRGCQIRRKTGRCWCPAKNAEW